LFLLAIKIRIKESIVEDRRLNKDYDP